MELNFSDDLIDLAKIFAKNNARLYVVGGYVRNAILGFCETDIDICSRLLPEEITAMLDKKGYEVKLVNPKLGTIHININGVEYEHTTFRAEKYLSGGAHSPEVVRFVDDIPLDASRRDFTANAIYYDILSGEVIDYYNGVTDVKEHILRTVETPEYVFSRDGLRILRLVRIASELNFEIDEHSFSVAKKMVSQLADISQERFNKEIISILFADYKYDSIIAPNAYIKGLKNLGALGAWEYVLPEVTKIVGRQKVRLLNENNWQNLILSAQPALRISALVVDMCAAFNAEISQDLVYAILGVGGIMLNKKECARQFKIVSAFNEVKRGNIYTDERGRMFLQNIDSVSNEVLGLCDIANIGKRLHQISKLMRLDKVPFNLKDLNINGNDIAEFYPEIEKNLYSKLLNKLLGACAIMPELNKKELLLSETKSIYKKIKSR